MTGTVAGTEATFTDPCENVGDLRADSEYEWTHTWNGHAIYPRDESTVELLDSYTRQIRALEDDG